MRIGLTLQNNTQELLTVEGSSVLNGSWQTSFHYGDTVSKLATATYWSEMDKRWESGPNSWLIAWIRFGTTKGYVTLGGAYNADVQGDPLSDEERKREISTGGEKSPFRAHVFVPRLLDAQVFVTGIDPDIYVQIFLSAKGRTQPGYAAAKTMLGAGSTRFVADVNDSAKLRIMRAPRVAAAVPAVTSVASAMAFDALVSAPPAQDLSPAAIAETPEESRSLYEESVRIEPVHTAVDWNKAPFV